MASNLESTAVFKARLEEKNLEHLLPKFKEKLNVSTLGELAFCTSFVPGRGGRKQALRPSRLPHRSLTSTHEASELRWPSISL